MQRWRMGSGGAGRHSIHTLLFSFPFLNCVFWGQTKKMPGFTHYLRFKWAHLRRGHVKVRGWGINHADSSFPSVELVAAPASYRSTGEIPPSAYTWLKKHFTNSISTTYRKHRVRCAGPRPGYLSRLCGLNQQETDKFHSQTQAQCLDKCGWLGEMGAWRRRED